jgi:hypothetical protein
MQNIQFNEMTINKINSTKFHLVYVNDSQIEQCTYIM